MDHDEARRIAVEHFASGGPQYEGWKVSGPTEDQVMTFKGKRPHLIFSFLPKDEMGWSRARPSLKVAIDLETGKPDMLR